MGTFIDLTGKVFTRLTVLRKLDSGIWECQCSCGNTKIANTSHLNSGSVSSCGCLKLEVRRQMHLTHGYTTDSKKQHTYDIWQAMKQRCLNSNNKDYEHYGGKGVTLCESWYSFENFLKDMGDQPVGLMIERKENSLGYSKENCYWATRKIQLDNRSVTVWVLAPDGRKLTASDAFREINCTKSMFFRKIKNPEGFMGYTLVGK